MKWQHALAVSMLWSTSVWAETQPPVDFTASTMAYNPKSGEVTLNGNVKVTQGTLDLTCQKLTMLVNQGGNISTMTANGNVAFTRQTPVGEESATGTTAVYQPSVGVLKLTGNVTLTRGGNTLNGEVLTYNIAGGQLNLSGGRTSVKGRFTPAATTGTTAP